MKIIRTYIGAFVSLLFVHLLCFAQQNGGRFTLEQVLGSPFPSNLVASRNGERIGWVFDAEGRRNIWIAEGPQFQARQLTRYNDDEGQEITDVAFTPDGNWIVYVRGGDKNRAGEIPNPTSDAAGATQAVYAVRWSDGRIERLGEGNSPVASPVDNQIIFSKNDALWITSVVERSGLHQLFSARGNNASPAWSPDGKLVAFVSQRGDHSFIGVYDMTKRTINYLAPSVDRDSVPRWSPDGTHLAFVRQPTRDAQSRLFYDDSPEPWAIRVADIAMGSAREVWRSASDMNGSLPPAGTKLLQWGADNRLVFTSEQDGWMHLYSIAATGGEAVLLTHGACEVENATVLPDHRSLIYSSNCGDTDRRHLWRVAVRGDEQPVAITSGERIEWSPAVTGDGAQLVYLSSDARQPAMPYVMTLAGGASRMIATEALPKDFPSAQLVMPQAALFKSVDGTEIHGQLFLPREERQGARHPAVIFMHGGPMRQMLLGWHYFYYYHNAYAFNQYLASRGYVVLSVNYRSGIGYGRTFRMATGRGARGASEYQDILAAARYLRERSDIDSSKIGLWGGSYGGYLTALGLARNSDLFAAGVDLHGVHDWSQRISGLAWIDYENRAAQERARESSPIASINKWRSPVLLIHGDDDRNVSFAQTIDLVRRLREQHVTFEQLIFPDEIHDFLLHRHWLMAYQAAAFFFDKYLKESKPKR